MVKEGTSIFTNWETFFPDEKKRHAIINFVNSVSSLDRLERLVLVKLSNGQEKLYVFFPTTDLTGEEMDKLGISLDESFAELDPHHWPILVEMDDAGYEEMGKPESKIKVAEAILLWERDQNGGMNIPAMFAPFA